MVKKKKRSSRRSKKTNKKDNKKDIWQYATVILGLLFLLSVFTKGFTDIPTIIPKDMGNKPTGNAKITLVEYSDFQCPFCARAAPTVKQILDEYGDQIEFVYKHFPLTSIHPQAQKAAEASECARDQGKFMEYHDIIFQNQNALTDADLKRYANQLGLDTGEFNECLDSDEKTSIVLADLQEGQSKGVRGTPTFFINDQQLVGAQPYENFKAVIEQELNTDESDEPEPEPEPEDDFIRSSIDDDPIVGSEDAKVVLIEFSDFQCPFCSRFWEQTLPSIKENYVETGKIQFVYRDFPLDNLHPQATPASEASECAHEQDMFWDFHDKLYLNYQSLNVDNYRTWAEELGIDMTQFNDCVDSKKYQSEVRNDFSDGQSSGVTGTPGFVIGIKQEDGTVVGENIKGAQPYSVFEAAIEKYLAQV